MKGKFFSLFIVGFLLCLILFWASSHFFSSNNEVSGTTKDSNTESPVEVSRKLPDCDISAKEALKPFEIGLTPYQEKELHRTEKALSKGISKIHNDFYARIKRSNPYWKDQIARSETVTSLDDVPENIKLALENHLDQRFNSTDVPTPQFDELVKFPETISLDVSPYFSYKIERPYRYVARYILNEPAPGVLKYEGHIAVTNDLEVIATEFPHRPSINSALFLSLSEVTRIARKHGYTLLHHYQPLSYEKDKVVLTLTTMYLPVNSSSSTAYQFCVAKFDMHTGMIVGTPYKSIMSK